MSFVFHFYKNITAKAIILNKQNLEPVTSEKKENI